MYPMIVLLILYSKFGVGKEWQQPKWIELETSKCLLLLDQILFFSLYDVCMSRAQCIITDF